MTMIDFKKGDSVRLLYLDGTISPTTFKIHDLWGDETHSRNMSYIIENTGGMEQYYHTDLLVRIGDVAPERVPLDGYRVPDGGEWYIARGNNRGWGRSQDPDQAVRRMRVHGKVTSWVLHRVSKWTVVDPMGALSYPRGIDPVEVKRVDPKKKAGAR